MNTRQAVRVSREPRRTLFVHTASFSGQELIIDPNAFPDVNVGDLLEIFAWSEFEALARRAEKRASAAAAAGAVGAGGAGGEAGARARARGKPGVRARGRAGRGSAPSSSRRRRQGGGGMEESSGPRRPRLVLEVTHLAPVRGNLKVSVRKDVANLFGLHSRQHVCVRPVQPSAVAVESLELSFKGQYFSRADMLPVKKALRGRCV